MILSAIICPISVISVLFVFMRELLEVPLSKNPEQGESLGSGVYKLRVEIEGKGTGERYGARIIHAIFSIVNKVYLMRVYDKSDAKDLSPSEKKEVRQLANEIRKEFKEAEKKWKDGPLS